MTRVFIADYQDKKQQSQAGKALLDFVLLEYYGMNPDSLKLLRSERGKPYFAGDPVYFNLSHSTGKIVLAVSDHPVGVDLEPMRRIRPEIGKRFLGIETDNQLELVRAWTRRESYGKMTGEGFFYEEPQTEHYFREYRCEGAAGQFFVCVCAKDKGFARSLVRVQLPAFSNLQPIENELL